MNDILNDAEIDRLELLLHERADGIDVTRPELALDLSVRPRPSIVPHWIFRAAAVAFLAGLLLLGLPVLLSTSEVTSTTAQPVEESDELIVWVERRNSDAALNTLFDDLDAQWLRPSRTASADDFRAYFADQPEILEDFSTNLTRLDVQLPSAFRVPAGQSASPDEIAMLDGVLLVAAMPTCSDPVQVVELGCNGPPLELGSGISALTLVIFAGALALIACACSIRTSIGMLLASVFVLAAGLVGLTANVAQAAANAAPIVEEIEAQHGDSLDCFEWYELQQQQIGSSGEPTPIADVDPQLVSDLDAVPNIEGVYTLGILGGIIGIPFGLGVILIWAAILSRAESRREKIIVACGALLFAALIVSWGYGLLYGTPNGALSCYLE